MHRCSLQNPIGSFSDPLLTRKATRVPSILLLRGSPDSPSHPVNCFNLPPSIHDSPDLPFQRTPKGLLQLLAYSHWQGRPTPLCLASAQGRLPVQVRNQVNRLCSDITTGRPSLPRKRCPVLSVSEVWSYGAVVAKKDSLLSSRRNYFEHASSWHQLDIGRMTLIRSRSSQCSLIYIGVLLCMRIC